MYRLAVVLCSLVAQAVVARAEPARRHAARRHVHWHDAAHNAAHRRKQLHGRHSNGAADCDVVLDRESEQSRQLLHDSVQVSK